MPSRQQIQAALAPKEKALFNLLYGARGHRPELHIDVLFGELCVMTPQSREDATYRQQRVGSIVSRTNTKLGYFGLKIEPGASRRSYRIVAAS